MRRRPQQCILILFVLDFGCWFSIACVIRVTRKKVLNSFWMEYTVWIWMYEMLTVFL